MHVWAQKQAGLLDGSAEFTCDLEISSPVAEAFRAAFGGRSLRAFHCTRLYIEEIDDIRAEGLRLLDQQL